MSYYRTQADAAIDNCGTDTGFYMVGQAGQAELFDNISQTAVKSRATFPGFSHAKITVQLVAGDSAGAYEPGTDQITITEARSVGSEGLFEAAHEYGHALNQTAMGGIVFRGVSPCESHNLQGISDYLCAYIEGIADYHAVAVWGSQLPATVFNLIDQGGYTMFESTLHQPVAAQIEAGVAATLLHIGDGTANRTLAPPFRVPRAYSDGAALGHAQIASAIRDCSVVLSDLSTHRADGIDYLVFCLERDVKQLAPIKKCTPFGACTTYPGAFVPTVDPVAVNAFSGLRSIQVPGGHTGNPLPAVSWTWGSVPTRLGYDLAVRNVWVCNLFYCS
jgi:hypothetical protein